MIKIKILVLILILSSLGFAQEKYFIYFKDKGIDKTTQISKSSPLYNSAVSILSERAINRRQKLLDNSDIIQYEDIPVSNEYLSVIEDMGIKVINKLDWFNSVSCYLNSDEITNLLKYTFIKKIEKVQKISYSKNDVENSEYEKPAFISNANYTYNYGASLTQNELSKIPFIHDMGITGKDILIGVLDSGFDWRNHDALKNMHIVSERDFVFNDNNTANEDEDSPSQHNHGTYVLSILGGYLDGYMIGTSFGSKFLLAKTEDIRTETTIEEDNYAAALQWMENQGVDITTSSLGYNEFDSGNHSYSYSDMNGNTAVITKAIELAFKKGVVTISSAGNEGDNSWFYITAPADGYKVISVGAVSSDNSIAAFSSRGPTSDGRIKPELTAMGVSVVGADASNGAYRYASGTSSAAPIAAGVAGLLLSKFPYLNNEQVRTILIESGENVKTPNNQIGYGLISAIKTLCFPNIRYDGNKYIINKIFNKSSIDPSSVTINYGYENDVISPVLMTYDNLSVYNFEFPELENGKLINFSFSYSNLSGNQFREPQIGTFKFKYGFLNVAENLVLNDDLDNVENNLISQNYPNPFTDFTNIDFYLADNLNVNISIFNILGQKIIDLFNGDGKKGKNSIIWYGKNNHNKMCSSGIYILVLKNGNKIESKKIVLLH
ncbi:MAG: S8 family serine peptidase [bacterium]